MAEGGLRLTHAIIICAVIAALVLAAIWLGRTMRSNEPQSVVVFISDTEVRFECEVAVSHLERSRGLMHRQSLETDKGMLFVFDPPQNVSFWMKNTLIPLDIIFIDEFSRVINVEAADPEPGVPDDQLITYSSGRPARWVVEINQGLSVQHGIGPGTEVKIETRA